MSTPISELAVVVRTPEEIASLAPLTPVQFGWLKLAADKANLFKELQKSELEVQGKLAGIKEEKDLATIQQKIKDAKAIADENQGRRMFFTKMLDEKLIQPAMAFEKRSFALIEDAKAVELFVRKQAAVLQSQQQLAAAEEERFKAHIRNEWHRIAVDYRQQLKNWISSQYIGALEQQVPVTQLDELKEQVKGGLRLAELSKFVKFQRAVDPGGLPKFISNERAQEIFKEFSPYNPLEDLTNAIAEVDQRFAMYPQDLLAHEAAVGAAKEEMAVSNQQANDLKEMEQATNNLVALSTPAPLVMVGAGNIVVKKIQAIVEEDSEAWAIAIMQDFLKNFHSVKSRLKNRTWIKLSLSQMAAALSRLKDENKTVQLSPIYKYQTIEK